MREFGCDEGTTKARPYYPTMSPAPRSRGGTLLAMGRRLVLTVLLAAAAACSDGEKPVPPPNAADTERDAFLNAAPAGLTEDDYALQMARREELSWIGTERARRGPREELPESLPVAPKMGGCGCWSGFGCTRLRGMDQYFPSNS